MNLLMFNVYSTQIPNYHLLCRCPDVQQCQVQDDDDDDDDDDDMAKSRVHDFKCS